jgi:hypothetical protein
MSKAWIVVATSALVSLSVLMHLAMINFYISTKILTTICCLLCCDGFFLSERVEICT